MNTLTHTLSVLATATALVTVSTPLDAHHGAAGYDHSVVTVLRATITELVWSNPHTLVRFDAPGADGAVRHWTVEASPPGVLARRGWDRSVLQPGMVVTVHFNAAQSGASFGLLRIIVLPDGDQLWAVTPAEGR